MNSASQINPSEEARLERLYSYKMLDTPEDPDFDHLVRMAAYICDTPMSAFSLVDRERVWFKAQNGMGARQVPIDLAFCASAIVSDEILVVPDAQLDERFVKNALVMGEPYIRFYAGYPVLSFDGQRIGTLCVLDKVPRRLSYEQTEMLKILALQAGALLESRRHQAELQRALDFEKAALGTLRALADGLNMGLFIENFQGETLFVNQGFESMFGTSKMPHEQISMPDAFAKMTEQIRQQSFPVTGQEVHTKDGREIERDYLPIMMDEKCNGHIWIYRDVSSQRQSEDVIEQQRTLLMDMGHLEIMAGGIAHELNNPLAVIMAKAGHLKSLVKNETSSDQLVIDYMENIQKVVMRVSAIIKGFKAFACNEKPDTCESLRLPVFIEDTLSFCRERLRNHGVELKVGKMPEIHFEARATQLSQVLLNLINNALDATEAHKERWIRLEAEADNTHVHFSVTDSGSGISAEIREKIFEPFYTTKAPGKGTGLGLSISKQIVADHRGKFFIDPQSKNTRFVISIPR